jgi:uncharacterized membrane protein YgcG
MRTVKRGWGRALLLAIIGLFGFALVPVSAANANVNNFTYAYWGSQYTVSLDADGRAHAHVVETLVARFPDFDQNRGIVRGLVTNFEGAPLNTRILSITDENGSTVPYETDRDVGILYLLLGDDDYVHGLTTYVIEYTLSDIVIPTETGRDEFYWNFLPLVSTQAIEVFEASVTFTGELANKFTGDAVCYQGYRGSTDRCDITGPMRVGDGIQFLVDGTEIPPSWGFTLAVGFTADTVVQPSARAVGLALDAAPYVALGASGVVTAAGGVVLARARRRARTATGIIVAQYEVPSDVPPLLASPVFSIVRSPIPAQMVHLAVSGAIRIESYAEKGRPRLHIADPDAPRDKLDVATMRELFSGSATSFTVPARSESFANNMRKLTKLGVTEAISRGYLVKERTRGARIAMWVSLAFIALAVIATFIGVNLGRASSEATLFVTFIGAFIIGIFALGFGAKHNLHTPKGALLYEHLAGLREFIRVAEADRLRVLQSVTGAETFQLGDEQVVHLYERLLPYAMLFGEEKSWGKVLETAYESSDSTPYWFYGGGTSNFSSQFSLFSSSASSSSSYTAPSSSGGGSGGGGFSGGGGGGGFSGGR